MADKVLESKDAVSAVALDAKKRAKEEAVLGYTIGKFGRLVIVSRKKYAHMRRCWDLLIDLDGNQSRFTKLSDEQVKAYKTGNMRQNQVVCEWAPEDMSELDVEVKALLKEEHKKAQADRKAFNKVLEDRKAKKAGNITVVANATEDNGKQAELDAQAKANSDKEAELKAREDAIKAKEDEAKANADASKTPAPQGNGQAK